MDDIKLEGTLDAVHLKKPHTYIRLRMNICTDDKLKQDQINRGVKCKTRGEIDDWREDKNIVPMTFENTVNFGKDPHSWWLFGPTFDEKYNTLPSM